MALKERRPPIPTGIGKERKARYEVKNTSYRAFLLYLSKNLDFRRTILSFDKTRQDSFVKHAELSEKAEKNGESLAKAAFLFGVIAKGIKHRFPRHGKEVVSLGAFTEPTRVCAAFV